MGDLFPRDDRQQTQAAVVQPHSILKNKGVSFHTVSLTNCPIPLRANTAIMAGFLPCSLSISSLCVADRCLWVSLKAIADGGGGRNSKDSNIFEEKLGVANATKTM
jgi:hypothetical protein